MPLSSSNKKLKTSLPPPPPQSSKVLTKAFDLHSSWQPSMCHRVLWIGTCLCAFLTLAVPEVSSCVRGVLQDLRPQGSHTNVVPPTLPAPTTVLFLAGRTALPETCLPEGNRRVVLVPPAFHDRLFVNLLLYTLLHVDARPHTDSDHESAEVFLAPRLCGSTESLLQVPS